MTKTTFKITNNNSNNDTTFPITNYSTLLDNIIATNIAKTNKYLFDDGSSDFYTLLLNDSAKKHTCNLCCLTNNNDKFTKAANFIANYGKNKSIKLPISFGKIYKLLDGTPIAFYEDEIQIGMDLYSYSDFKDITFLNSLPKKTKNIIINIFNAKANSIEININ